jgi:hypothetical protein
LLCPVNRFLDIFFCNFNHFFYSVFLFLTDKNYYYTIE